MLEQLTIWHAIGNAKPSPLYAERGFVFEHEEAPATRRCDIWQNSMLSFSEDWQWVYFVEAKETGLIKIGISVDPDQRLKQLQVSSPVRLRLIAAVYGSINLERRLHRQFADRRTTGEWFRDCEAIRTEIDRLTELTIEDSAQIGP